MEARPAHSRKKCSFSSFRSLQNCRSLDYFGGKFVIAHRCLVPKIERYDLTFLVGGLDQPKSDLVSTIYVDYVAAEYPFKDLAFCQDVALVKYRSARKSVPANGAFAPERMRIRIYQMCKLTSLTFLL